jgi:UDP-N-acetyl-D-glucosamine dehydrogenase
MINELTLLCGKINIDIWEVISAAKTKPYGFMPFYPGPGIGGHCIAVDPFYLSYKAREYGFFTRFIDLAGEINALMPHYVVTRIIWALNLHNQSVRNAKILIWGVSYKKDIADSRESAAYPIIADILKKDAKVDYFDPYIPNISISQYQLKSIKYSPSILKNYDLVVILTNHSGFDYTEIAKNAKLLIDTRNAIASRKFKNVYYL